MFPLTRQARVIAWVVPARYWYSAALALSRLQGRLGAHLLGRNGALTEASMLDSWVMELTRHGPFPIPMTVSGLDVIERAAPDGNILFCWAHLPLFEMALRAGVVAGWDAVMIVDSAHMDAASSFPVPGLTQRCSAIPAGPAALTRARTLMQAGKHIGCLLDYSTDAPVSSNILRFAGTMRAHVLFCWGKRSADGHIHVTFMDAPRPKCEDEQAVQQNIDFLQTEKRRILNELQVTATTGSNRPVAAT